jgi:hypothetical protein
MPLPGPGLSSFSFLPILDTIVKQGEQILGRQSIKKSRGTRPKSFVSRAPGSFRG